MNQGFKSINDRKNSTKNKDHLKTLITVDSANSANSANSAKRQVTEFWSGVGTIIYGNYIRDGKKIPVFIVGLENDKSCGISRKQSRFELLNKFNTFKKGRNSSENVFNGIYEDFGGAVQIKKEEETPRPSDKSPELYQYVYETIIDTAYNELKEETANLIDIHPDILCRRDNYIDYLMSPTDNFGRTRLYYIRLSDKIITNIIDKQLIMKNYKRIIHNLKNENIRDLYFANYHVIKNMKRMTKTDVTNGVTKGVISITRLPPHDIINKKKLSILKEKFKGKEGFKEEVDEITFNYNKQKKNFPPEISSYIKSYLEVCDIGVIPIDNTPSNISKSIIHPFESGKTLNTYIVKDIDNNDICLDNRTGIVLYGDYSNSHNTKQFVKVDIMGKSEIIIDKNLATICKELLESENLSNIIKLKGNHTSENNNEINTNYKFFLKKTVSFISSNNSSNNNFNTNKYSSEIKFNEFEPYNLRNNSPSSANDTANSTANSTANGTANGSSNGNAKGNAKGSSNGTTNNRSSNGRSSNDSASRNANGNVSRNINNSANGKKNNNN